MTAAAVTERLGVDPTCAHEDGEAVGPRSSGVREGSIWLLTSSKDIEAGVELEVQLERLLSVLEPRATALWALVTDGYEADWFCFVASDAAEHAVELSRSLLSRLLQLPGDLLLDVCGDSDG